MKHLGGAVSILVIILLLTGCFANSDDYSDTTIEKAQKTVESYIRNNYEDVKTIEFNDDHSNPMGGLMVRGKVNGQAGFVVDWILMILPWAVLVKKVGFLRERQRVKRKIVITRWVAHIQFAFSGNDVFYDFREGITKKTGIGS
ncbi:DUF1433 domain-containing protein [Virgibacillus sp. 179-BFC.A HS]|uniref:DUF1433 domain-containing protein n=1 Tax=Tigheibacillus jepli TaxID=3035914 RepID=A0ABU5CDZ6_9BACI|nr:DUF1433 domain-containing protein [Virgibacillus sp. 179-BFC.A HS]MDY0404067.1 DUF1433 domain-containing protein [Virgibacillus sp. 179-BFC.A HS]